MRITLYKGCILTHNYQEVFDTKIRAGKTTSVFEDYLATLKKADYDVNGYVTDNGSFNINYSFAGLSPFECNYVKFTDDSKVVYAFVDRVIRSNNLVTVFYTCDVFHTYFPQCRLRDSLISNFRKKVDGEHAELPLNYLSNKGLDTAFLGNNVSNQVYIIARIQKYKLVSGSDSSVRETAYVLISKTDKAVVGTYVQILNNPLFDIDECIELIQKLESYQGTTKIFIWNKSLADDNQNYEIDDIYILPEQFNMSTAYNVPHMAFDMHTDEGSIGNINSFGAITLDGVNYFSLNIATIRNTILNNDDLVDIELEVSGPYISLSTDKKTMTILPTTKQYGFGFITNVIELPFNNLGYDINFKFSGNRLEFKLLMYCNTSIIDITEIFSYMLPFSGITGESYAQRKIAKAQETMKGATKIFNGASKLASSAQNSAAAFVQLSTNPIAANYSINQAAESGRQGISMIANGIFDIVMANKEKYQNTYGVNVNTAGITAALCGMIMVTIDPENIIEVQSAINEIGYSVFYKANDLEYGQDITEWNYNVVKFINAKVVGSATQEVLAEIKQILENGVKVWYTTNVS